MLRLFEHVAGLLRHFGRLIWPTEGLFLQY